jgi:Flp pilus assembly protein TadG
VIRVIHRGERRARTRSRGTVTITVVVALAALLAAGALSIDAGMIWSARTQLQNVADGAALAAALNMIDKTGPTVTIPEAETAAVDNASQNSAGSTASVALDPAEMAFGDWDLEARTLDTSVDLSEPDNVTGVEVVAHLDDAQNRPVPAFLARVLGKDSFPVTARATAYLGFAGSLGPGYVDLPIAIDCCEISGPECEASYCETITNDPPNFGDYATAVDGNSEPCFLADGVTPASCIDFYSNGNQIACWTAFKEEHPSIATPDLTDIVEDGNPIEVSVEDSYYLDSGIKTPVIEDIYDRFHGLGEWAGNPAGTDLDADGDSDTWVVALPVIECQQDGAECAKGTSADMVGVVCFNIQEIIVTPDKRIKGRFLCKEDVAFKDCDLGPTGTGGKNFDVRADFPVLVR